MTSYLPPSNIVHSHIHKLRMQVGVNESFKKLVRSRVKWADHHSHVERREDKKSDQECGGKREAWNTENVMGGLY